MCWRLDNQDGFVDLLYSNVGEARHWCDIDSIWTVYIVGGRVYGVSIVQVFKIGTSLCGTF
jgi:hypothetical protein